MRFLRPKICIPSFLPRLQSALSSHSLAPALPATKSSAASSPWFPDIRTSIATRDLLLGKKIHARIIIFDQANDRFVINNLISMYSKCGSLVYARYLFDKMPYRDLITWNAILAAYAQWAEFECELVEEGFDLFRDLIRKTVAITALTLSPVLKLCLVAESLKASVAVHGFAVKVGLGFDGFVSGALVNIYSRFGLAKDARILFDRTLDEDKDVVLWKVMIIGYLRAGMVMDMCELFSDFHGEGFCPDDDVLDCFLGEEFWEVYEQAAGFVDQVQGLAVKNSYLFDDNQGDDHITAVLSFNRTLSHRLKAGDDMKAVIGFAKLNELGFRYDATTMVMVLAAVAGLNCLSLGKQVHSMTLKSGFYSDLLVSNSFINMYDKVGGPSYAQYFFSNMEKKDLISWNSMISICAHGGMNEEAVTLLRSLLISGLSPDPFTITSFLKACSSMKEGVRLSKEVHALALRSDIIADSFVSTALVDVYSRNSRMKDAEFVIHSSEDSDVAASNSLMFGYVSCEDSQKALELFNLMRKKGKVPDEVTLATIFRACGASLALGIGKQIHALGQKVGYDSDLCVGSGILDMYLKCGDMNDADKVFRSISYPDDVAWTTMISGCIENGDEERTLHLYNQMRQCGYFPDEYTLSAVVKAASCSAAIEQGKQIHSNVIKLNSVSDPFVSAALVDMYAKSGNIENAYQVFKCLDSKDITVWNAMLVGLAQYGMGEEAVSLFQAMTLSGFLPDKVTFIGVLSACSHSNLFLKAYEHFNAMQSQYGIKPEIEHYSCLVDALARGGFVQEAEKLISSIPFQPSAAMYRALLSACRNKGDAETGKRAAEKLIALEPSDPSPYVILYNIYASDNRWDEAINTRSLMRKGSVKKDPGFSYVDSQNKVHLFTSDDRSHPQADIIYVKLYEMMRNIKEEGYTPDTEVVLLDVDDEEKERSLWQHSEKLAVAFGLISTPAMKPIRVIKNIRICSDCHNAVKRVSKVYKREIILRDVNRFHWIVDGVCSCGDFW
ncbi:unnamed protein product [Rhodiola kirilowii]